MNLRLRISEMYYWQVHRRTERILPWFAGKLPRRLKYWVLIDAVRHIRDNENVPSVPLATVAGRAGDEISEAHR
jgi:hypothetical protein